MHNLVGQSPSGISSGCALPAVRSESALVIHRAVSFTSVRSCARTCFIAVGAEREDGNLARLSLQRIPLSGRTRGVFLRVPSRNLYDRPKSSDEIACGSQPLRSLGYNSFAVRRTARTKQYVTHRKAIFCAHPRNSFVQATVMFSNLRGTSVRAESKDAPVPISAKRPMSERGMVVVW